MEATAPEWNIMAEHWPKSLHGAKQIHFGRTVCPIELHVHVQQLTVAGSMLTTLSRRNGGPFKVAMLGQLASAACCLFLPCFLFVQVRPPTKDPDFLA